MFPSDFLPRVGSGTFRGVVAFLAALAAMDSGAGPAADPTPPNILFFITDDESAVERSAYGWYHAAASATTASRTSCATPTSTKRAGRSPRRPS